MRLSALCLFRDQRSGSLAPLRSEVISSIQPLNDSADTSLGHRPRRSHPTGDNEPAAGASTILLAARRGGGAPRARKPSRSDHSGSYGQSRVKGGADKREQEAQEPKRPGSWLGVQALDGRREILQQSGKGQGGRRLGPTDQDIVPPFPTRFGQHGTSDLPQPALGSVSSYGVANLLGAGEAHPDTVRLAVLPAARL